MATPQGKALDKAKSGMKKIPVIDESMRDLHTMHKTYKSVGSHAQAAGINAAMHYAMDKKGYKRDSSRARAIGEK